MFTISQLSLNFHRYKLTIPRKMGGLFIAFFTHIIPIINQN